MIKSIIFTLIFKTLTNARPTMSFVKMEEDVKIWSMVTNVFANQDSMERIAKTTSTNAEESFVKMEEPAKIRSTPLNVHAKLALKESSVKSK